MQDTIKILQQVENVVNYSYLNASTGLTFTACHEGHNPEKHPTKNEKTRTPTIRYNGIETCKIEAANILTAINSNLLKILFQLSHL